MKERYTINSNIIETPKSSQQGEGGCLYIVRWIKESRGKNTLRFKK